MIQVFPFHSIRIFADYNLTPNTNRLMDMDNIRYVSLANRMLMFSEEPASIINFISTVVGQPPKFNQDTVGAFFYKHRLYLFLVFSSSDGKRFQLFRMDDFREKKSFMALESMILNMVPYTIPKLTRDNAAALVGFLKTEIRDNGKFDEGKAIYPDTAI